MAWRLLKNRRLYIYVSLVYGVVVRQLDCLGFSAYRRARDGPDIKMGGSCCGVFPGGLSYERVTEISRMSSVEVKNTWSLFHVPEYIRRSFSRNILDPVMAVRFLCILLF
jgi:hypothetical protein